jgi:hypothetical protein
MMQQKFGNIINFEFKPVNEEIMKKYIKNMKTDKATGCDNIPAKFIHLCGNELAIHISNLFNECFKSCTFPSLMKKAEIVPIFKKANDMIKGNYRPVSILTAFDKLFETVIADQLGGYFDQIFNDMLCAYRKRYGCNHILIKLVDSWKLALDNDEYVGTILMDLSKAFDCIPHGLLICKLRAYGVNPGSCTFMANYLTDRFQRVKLQDCRSEWNGLKKGVPQGSCLGPLIFNIFINDLFLFIKNCDLLNYADDNTLSKTEKFLNLVIEALCKDTKASIDWFKLNLMKVNPDKFQAMLMKPLNSTELLPDTICIDDVIIKREDNVKLFGITVDDKLKFIKHVNNLCNRAASQLNVMYRFKNIFSFEDKKRIYNTFILSNFNYCPIVWHFCGKSEMRKLERIQERALRYLLNDNTSSYDSLLSKSSMDTLHLKRLKSIACEVFKSLNDLNPIFMKRMFNLKDTEYDLRNTHILVQPKFDKMRYGKATFSYYGAHLWNLLPNDIKVCETLSNFKDILRMWDGPACQCSLCDFM